MERPEIKTLRDFNSYVVKEYEKGNFIEEVELSAVEMSGVIKDSYVTKSLDFFLKYPPLTKPTPPIKSTHIKEGLFCSEYKKEYDYQDPIYVKECEEYFEDMKSWKERRDFEDSRPQTYIVITSCGPLKIRIKK